MEPERQQNTNEAVAWKEQKSESEKKERRSAVLDAALSWPSHWKLTAGIFLIASLCHMKAGFLVATYIDVRGNKEEVDRKRAVVLLFVPQDCWPPAYVVFIHWCPYQAS